MQVLRKPLQVLMFASAAMRDYQFARTLLVREMEKERVLLSIYLQPPPGETQAKPGIIQDIPAKRLLEAFPENLDARQATFHRPTIDSSANGFHTGRFGRLAEMTW